MPTPTISNTRTITGYLINLLDYPRWVIEREVDFTDCHFSGDFDSNISECASCNFGQACCWLNQNRAIPSLSAPLAELVQALQTAVTYMRSPGRDESPHAHDCDCDACLWLREASHFLRVHRHRS